MLYQDTVFTKLRTEDGAWTNKALHSLYKFMLSENPHTNIRAVGGGFPEGNVKNDIIPKLDITKKETARILIFNDLQLILYNELLNAGYNQNNIYLCYQDWLRKETNIVYTDIMNVYIESNFRDYEIILHNYVSLEEAINLSQQTKFDYIIANPPFQMGNGITRQVMKSVDFDSYINLMPAGYYKPQKLFRKVVVVDNVQNYFEDASIGDSLTLCILKKADGPFQTYEEFSNQFRDPRFVDFYALNMHYKGCLDRYPYQECATFLGSEACVRAAAEAHLQGIKNEGDGTSFCITKRTVLDGTLRTANCYDYQWNILHNADLKQPITYIAASNSGRTTVGFIRHMLPEAQRNLCTFWYNNPLCCELIWGLNKSSGTASPAIPNVDFAKDRDWEHCTLEDLMNWLREDNEPA